MFAPSRLDNAILLLPRAQNLLRQHYVARLEALEHRHVNASSHISVAAILQPLQQTKMQMERQFNASLEAAVGRVLTAHGHQDPPSSLASASASASASVSESGHSAIASTSTNTDNHIMARIDATSRRFAEYLAKHATTQSQAQGEGALPSTREPIDPVAHFQHDQARKKRQDALRAIGRE